MDSDLSGAFGYRKLVEKAKPAQSGETRNWGGVQYTKQPDGNWKPKASMASSPADVEAPRGKPTGELHGYAHGMMHTVDFGDKHGEHDVHVHYNYDEGASARDVREGIASGVGSGAQIDGDPAVINRHGEDVTHLVSPEAMKKLHERIHEHAGEGKAYREEARAARAEDAAEARAEGRRQAREEGWGDEDKGLGAALTFFQFVEKGKAARAGETRNWGGQDYTKQPDGSWKPKAAGKAVVPSSQSAGGWKPKSATHRVTWWQGPGGTTVSQNFTSEVDAKAHAAKLTAYPDRVKVEPIGSVGGEVPRGKPANKKGWDRSMKDTLDFNWGKGDANEHDVDVHYIAHPGERGGRYEDAQPPYAEVMVVNQHGEDVTHHVPEKHIKDIEARALRHAGERAAAGREPIDSRI